MELFAISTSRKKFWVILNQKSTVFNQKEEETINNIIMLICFYLYNIVGKVNNDPTVNFPSEFTHFEN